MRKLLVVVIAMMFLVATGDVGDTLAADGVIKAIIDFPGDGDISGSGYSVTADIDAGVGIGFDVLFDSAEMFDIGIGFIYQFPRSVEDDAGKVNFMPIYLVGKGYLTDENQQVRPYLYGHLGYNFFFGDDDFTGSADLEGGLYYSVGLGLLFNNKFLIEAGWSVNNGTATDSGYVYVYNTLYHYTLDADVEYSKLSLSVGYAF